MSACFYRPRPTYTMSSASPPFRPLGGRAAIALERGKDDLKDRFGNRAVVALIQSTLKSKIPH